MRSSHSINQSSWWLLRETLGLSQYQVSTRWYRRMHQLAMEAFKHILNLDFESTICHGIYFTKTTTSKREDPSMALQTRLYRSFLYFRFSSFSISSVSLSVVYFSLRIFSWISSSSSSFCLSQKCFCLAHPNLLILMYISTAGSLRCRFRDCT